MSLLLDPPLSNLRILVVEDALLISEMIADILHDAGCEVVGPATSLERGTTLASNENLDGAFLDVNLTGEPSFSIAEILTRREVPIAFLTGYGESAIPETYRQIPFLSKPFQVHELVALVRCHFTKDTRYKCLASRSALGLGDCSELPAKPVNSDDPAYGIDGTGYFGPC